MTMPLSSKRQKVDFTREALRDKLISHRNRFAVGLEAYKGHRKHEIVNNALHGRELQTHIPAIASLKAWLETEAEVIRSLLEAIAAIDESKAANSCQVQ